MPNSTPVLSNRLKIIVGAIHELDDSAQRVSNRLQMAIGVVCSRNIITVAILNLAATVLIVDTGRSERVLSAVSGTHDGSIDITNIELFIAAVLRLIHVRGAHLSQFYATT